MCQSKENSATESLLNSIVSDSEDYGLFAYNLNSALPTSSKLVLHILHLQELRLMIGQVKI